MKEKRNSSSRRYISDPLTHKKTPHRTQTEWCKIDFPMTQKVTSSYCLQAVYKRGNGSIRRTSVKPISIAFLYHWNETNAGKSTLVILFYSIFFIEITKGLLKLKSWINNIWEMAFLGKLFLLHRRGRVSFFLPFSDALFLIFMTFFNTFVKYKNLSRENNRIDEISLAWV